jgi:hypothetical protein
MTAGENLVFGDVCYMKSDGKLWKADYNSSTTMPGIAIAGESISAGTTGTFILPCSYVRDNTWNWTAGSLLYTGTSGSIASTAPSGSGDQIQVLGISISGDIILFNPSYVLVEVT